LKVTITFASLPGCKPTIYDHLKRELGREPSHEELKAKVQRILSGVAEVVEANRLHAENEP